MENRKRKTVWIKMTIIDALGWQKKTTLSIRRYDSND